MVRSVVLRLFTPGGKIDFSDFQFFQRKQIVSNGLKKDTQVNYTDRKQAHTHT